ncbi:unnamed protein product, partial [marine sediment metagenome]
GNMFTREKHGHGWQYITADRIVNEGETLLYQILINASADGGDISVYEGLDAQSGRLVGTFVSLQNHMSSINFHGIFLDRGLFIDVGTSITGVLVIYDTLREVNPNIED